MVWVKGLEESGEQEGLLCTAVFTSELSTFAGCDKSEVFPKVMLLHVGATTRGNLDDGFQQGNRSEATVGLVDGYNDNLEPGKSPSTLGTLPRMKL